MQTAAFYDAPVLITSLNVVKSYLLIGDVQKGSFFVRWVGTVWLPFKAACSVHAPAPPLCDAQVVSVRAEPCTSFALLGSTWLLHEAPSMQGQHQWKTAEPAV